MHLTLVLQLWIEALHLWIEIDDGFSLGEVIPGEEEEPQQAWRHPCCQFPFDPIALDWAILMSYPLPLLMELWRMMTWEK
jgi:hypothetical protein